MRMPPELFDFLPDPVQVHARLGQIAREQRILRRLLSLTLSAQRERQEDETPPGHQADEVRRGR
jgi:hypothetical protein